MRIEISKSDSNELTIFANFYDHRPSIAGKDNFVSTIKQMLTDRSQCFDKLTFHSCKVSSDVFVDIIDEICEKEIPIEKLYLKSIQPFVRYSVEQESFWMSVGECLAKILRSSNHLKELYLTSYPGNMGDSNVLDDLYFALRKNNTLKKLSLEQSSTIIDNLISDNQSSLEELSVFSNEIPIYYIYYITKLFNALKNDTKIKVLSLTGQLDAQSTDKLFIVLEDFFLQNKTLIDLEIDNSFFTEAQKNQLTEWLDINKNIRFKKTKSARNYFAEENELKMLKKEVEIPVEILNKFDEEQARPLSNLAKRHRQEGGEPEFIKHKLPKKSATDTLDTHGLFSSKVKTGEHESQLNSLTINCDFAAKKH
ncbi:hypothetical protein [Legionella norrlandica]|uniref:hypothetical protein n=1 Tax=Legionella norrlandica TaxID=1498499 RepID=UPI001269BFC1|nr:hypothetical protein [Legionella norrlandica]